MTHEFAYVAGDAHYRDNDTAGGLKKRIEGSPGAATVLKSKGVDPAS